MGFSTAVYVNKVEIKKRVDGSVRCVTVNMEMPTWNPHQVDRSLLLIEIDLGLLPVEWSPDDSKEFKITVEEI